MARTKHTARKKGLAARKDEFASRGIFLIGDTPEDKSTPQQIRRNQYGNEFLRHCLEQKLPPIAGSTPKTEDSEENSVAQPLSPGLYLWDWRNDDHKNSYEVQGGLLDAERLPMFFRNADIVTSTTSWLQVHLEERAIPDRNDQGNVHDDGISRFNATAYTKDEAYSWEYHHHLERTAFLKMPESINRCIDRSPQLELYSPIQYGGPKSDVWAIQRADLIALVKPQLDELAANTQDRPIPRYQMIIDPNQCERKGIWVPSEFDIHLQGQDHFQVQFVGGDRAHWMDTDVIQSVAEPILQASLPLLSKLKCPKLLLEALVGTATIASCHKSTENHTAAILLLAGRNRKG